MPPAPPHALSRGRAVPQLPLQQPTSPNLVLQQQPARGHRVCTQPAVSRLPGLSRFPGVCPPALPPAPVTPVPAPCTLRARAQNANLRSISFDEVITAQKAGAVLMARAPCRRRRHRLRRRLCVAAALSAPAPAQDVRPAEEFEAFHAPGAVNVPLFVPVSGTSPDKLLKQFLFAINGVKGTDENPNFLADAERAAPSKSNVLVVCDVGGSVLPSGALQDGKRSRSLFAAYKLLAAGGFKEVYHVGGGMIGWAEDDHPLEGNDPERWVAERGRKPR